MPRNHAQLIPLGPLRFTRIPSPSRIPKKPRSPRHRGSPLNPESPITGFRYTLLSTQGLDVSLPGIKFQDKRIKAGPLFKIRAVISSRQLWKDQVHLVPLGYPGSQDIRLEPEMKNFTPEFPPKL